MAFARILKADGSGLEFVTRRRSGLVPHDARVAYLPSETTCTLARTPWLTFGPGKNVLGYDLGNRARESLPSGALPGGECEREEESGWANGTSAEQLAAAGFRAFGIDNANLRYEQWTGRIQSPRVALLKADATAITFENGTFDIVLSSGMLEHIALGECTPEYRVYPLPDRIARVVSTLAEQRFERWAGMQISRTTVN